MIVDDVVVAADSPNSHTVTLSAAQANQATTVKIWLEDNVGNVDPANAAEVELRYDNIAPGSVVAIPGSVGGPKFDVGFTSTDPGATANPVTGSGIKETFLWRRFAGPGKTCAETAGGENITWTEAGSAIPPITKIEFTPASGDGTYCFYTQAVDNATNQEPNPGPATQAKGETVYDNTPPATTVQFAGPNYATATSTFIAQATTIDFATEAGAKTYYSVDDDDPDAFTEFTTQLTAVDFANDENPHNLYFYSVDALGNVEIPAQKVVVEPDLTAPPMPANLTANGKNPSDWTPNTEFSLAWQASQDAGSGIAKARVKTVGGAAVDASLTSHTLDLGPGAANGGTTVLVWFEDNVGNGNPDNNSAGVEIRFDNVAPETHSVFAPAAVAVSPISVSFTAGDFGYPNSGSGASEGFLWTRGSSAAAWTSTGLSASTATGSFSFAPTNDGEYQFFVQVRDAAGNTSLPRISSAAHAATFYGGTAPVISDVIAADITHDRATVRWTTNDETTGIVEYGTTTALGRMATTPLAREHEVVLDCSLLSPAKIFYRVKAVNRAALETIDVIRFFETGFNVTLETDMFGVVNVEVPLELTVTNPEFDSVSITLQNGITVTTSIALQGGVDLFKFRLDGLDFNALFPTGRASPPSRNPYVVSGGGVHTDVIPGRSVAWVTVGEVVAPPTDQEVGKSRVFAGFYHRIDPVKPASIVDLSALTGPDTGQITFSWTAPGDDAGAGTAMAYDLRIATLPITVSGFIRAGRATQAPLPVAAGGTQEFVLSGLMESTTYYFAVRALDEIENVSPVIAFVEARTLLPSESGVAPEPGSVVIEVPPEITDPTPPPSIDIDVDPGVALSGLQTLTVALGDFVYQTRFVIDSATRSVRLAHLSINGGSVLTSTATTPGSSILNAAAGQAACGPSVSEEPAGYLSSGNGRSYLGYYATIDPREPGVIADLSASPGNAAGEVALAWSAAGDDAHVGTAMTYDLRLSTDPITEANFNQALRISLETVPTLAGSSQEETVSGLDNGTTYYFALKALDELLNAATYFNLASAKTLELAESDDLIDGAPIVELLSSVAGVTIEAVSTTTVNPAVAVATSAAAAQGFVFVSQIYDILSPDESLPGGATIQFRYDESGLESFKEQLRIYHYEEQSGVWIQLADATVLPERNPLLAYVTSLSFFAILLPDEEAPATTLAYVGGGRYHRPSGGIYVSTATRYRLSARDPPLGRLSGLGVAVTEYRVDSALSPFTPIDSGDPLIALPEGLHTIQFRSVDRAGNAERVQTAASAVDGAPPAPVFSAAADIVETQDGIIIETVGAAQLAVRLVDPLLTGGTQDNGSGIAASSYSFDGGAPAPADMVFTLTVDPGEHSLTLLAQDNVGNRFERTLAVNSGDFIPPAISKARAAAAGSGVFAPLSAPLQSPDADMRVTVYDALSGIDAALSTNTARLSTDGGATFTAVPLASISLTGPSGSTEPRILTVSGLALSQSLGPEVETNQVVFTVGDLAGNTAQRRYVIAVNLNPVTPLLPTAPAADEYSVLTAPVFTWRLAARISSAAIESFQVQAADNPGFTSTLLDELTTETTLQAPVVFADGGYYWRVRAKDNFGTYSPYTAALKFSIDTISPVFTAPQVAAAGSGSFVATTTALNSLLVDARASIQDLASGLATSVGVRLSTDGGQTFTDIPAQNVGLTGASGTTEPQFLSAAGMSLVESASLTTPTNFLEMTASDLAGNTTSFTFGVLVDTTPPSVAVLSPAAGQVFVATRDTLEADFTVQDRLDPTPSFEAFLIQREERGTPRAGRPALIPVTTGQVFEPLDLDDGLWELQVSATDFVRNSTTVLGGVFEISHDLLPPRTALTIGTPQAAGYGFTYLTRDTVLTFEAIDDQLTVEDGAGLGVAAIEVQVGGALRRRFENPSPAVGQVFRSTLTLADPNGVLELGFNAEDTSENIETVHTGIVAVDNTAPALSITWPPADALLATNAPTLTITYFDSELTVGVPGSGVNTAALHISVDGEDRSAAAITTETGATLSLAGLAEGPHHVEVEVADRLGNASSAKVDFTIDSISPAVTVTTPTAGTVMRERKPLIRALYTDAGSGLKQDAVKLLLDGVEVPAQIETNGAPGGTPGPWKTTTQLPYGLSALGTVVWNGRVYIIGGYGGPKTYNDEVGFAVIGGDGGLGPWQSTTPLPKGILALSAVVHDGVVYVVGGQVPGGIINDVYFARIKADGNLENWTRAASLPFPGGTDFGGAVVINGFIYVIGGENYSCRAHREVFFAKACATGLCSGWSATTSLPIGIFFFDATMVGDGIYVYVPGGNDRGCSESQVNTVWHNTSNPDGTLNQWTQTTPLPRPTAGHVTLSAQDHLYVIGDRPGARNVYFAPLLENHDVGDWTDDTSYYLPKGVMWAAGESWQDRLYVMGGFDENSHISKDVLFTELSAGGAVTVSTATFTPVADLLEGPHTITAQALDIAGNPGSGESTFTVDITPPLVAVASPAAGGVYIATRDALEIGFTVTDNYDPNPSFAAALVQREDNGSPRGERPALIPVTSGQAFEPLDLDDGIWELQVSATDFVQNSTFTAFGTFEILHDIQPPRTVFTVGAGSAPATSASTPSAGTVFIRSDTPLILSSTDDLVEPEDGIGLGTVFQEAAVDGQLRARFTNPAVAVGRTFISSFTLSADTEGPHVLAFFAEDTLSNRAVAQSTSVFVDDTGPVVDAIYGAVPVVRPPGTESWYAADFDITWQAADAASGLAWVDPPAHVTVEGRDLSFEGRASDRLGNAGQKSVSVNLDKTPALVDAGEAFAAPEGSPARFTGTVTDNLDPAPVFAWAFGDGGDAVQVSSPSHVYIEDGVYFAVLTSTDHAAHMSSDTVRVTVINAAPSVAAIDDRSVTEGSYLDLTVSFTDPGVLDTHLGEVNWGDGIVSSMTVAEENGSGTVSARHAFGDDGTYTVHVSVQDDDGGVSNSTFTVTVGNVAPTLAGLPNLSANEGSFIQLPPAAFTDPGFDNPAGGTGEDFTATVDWGDGTSEPAADIALTEVPGSEGTATSGTIQARHTYADDGVYTVGVTVQDDDGGVSNSSFTVTVGNVAPIMAALPDLSALEGNFIQLPPAAFTDPGFDNPAGSTNESFTATIDWGDGTSEPAGDITLNETPGKEGTATSGTIQAQHAYGDNGSYAVTVIVQDDDGGVSQSTFVVTVGNVAPILAALPDLSALEGSFIQLPPATFTDPGFDSPAAQTQENFTATVDWGDGTSEPAADIALSEAPGKEGTPTSGTIQARHAYADDGVYTVGVTVQDDDGGARTQNFKVTVANAAPILAALPNLAADEGSFIQLPPAAFTDPGFDNPAGSTNENFTATIDWGDGTSEPIADIALNETPGKEGTSTAGTILARHAYGDNGSYHVTVTVRDDDGGADSKSFTVAVENAAPAVTAGADTYAAAGGYIFVGGSVPARSIQAFIPPDTTTLVQLPIGPADTQDFAPADYSDPGFDNPAGGTREDFVGRVDWGDGNVTTTGFDLSEAAGREGESTTGRLGGARHPYAENGRYDVSIRVADDDGGEDSAGFRVTVDRVPPVTTESFTGVFVSPQDAPTGVPADADVFLSTWSRIVLTAEDPSVNDVATGVQRTFWRDGSSGAYNLYNGPFGLTPGVHEAGAFSVDNRGNEEAPKVLKVGVDAGPPATTLRTVGGRQYPGPDAGSFYASADTVYELPATDPVDQGVSVGVAFTRYREVPGAFQNLTSSFLLIEGVRPLEYQSQDKVENLEVLRSTTVLADGTPPVTASTIGTPLYMDAAGIQYITPQTPLDFSAEDPKLPGEEPRTPGSGLSRIELSVDSGAFEVSSGSLRLPEGRRGVLYRAVDNVENTEGERPIHVRVDDTKPVSVLEIGEPAHILPDGTLLVAGITPFGVLSEDPEVREVASGVRETLYRAYHAAQPAPAFGTYTGTFTMTAPDGLKTIEFYAEDNVDNIEVARSSTVLLDVSRPTASLLCPSPEARGICRVFSGAFPVLGTVLDAHLKEYQLESAPGDNAFTDFTLISSGTAGIDDGVLGVWDTTALAGPRTLRLTVVDFVGNASIIRMNVQTGGPARQLVLGGGGTFNHPSGVAAGPEDHIYVADSNDDRVRVFDSSGSLIATHDGGNGGTHDFNKPKDLAVDTSGYIYLADTLNNRIVKLSPAGEEVLDIGDVRVDKKGTKRFYSGDGEGALHHPSGVALDGAGNIYVSDSDNRRIQVFGADGVFLRGFTLPPRPEDSQDDAGDEPGVPTGLALDAAGAIYVADPKGRRAYKFDPDGQVLLTIGKRGTGPGEFEKPMGIAVSPMGDCIMVSDWHGSRVQKFDKNGDLNLVFGVQGNITDNQPLPEELALQHPVGLAMDASGRLLVADRSNKRVQRFGLSEGMTLLAAAYGEAGWRRVTKLVEKEQGGMVSRIDKAAVNIPPDALPEDTDITISAASEDETAQKIRLIVTNGRQLEALCEPVEYSPHGLRFRKPVTLTLPYDPSQLLAQGATEDALRINYWNTETKSWEDLESTVDPINKTVSAQTYHFSLYQVLVPKAQLSAPADFTLREVYVFPDPAVRGAEPTFHVEVGIADSVLIIIYNVAGQETHRTTLTGTPAIINDGSGADYAYEYKWSGRIPSGVYLYTISAEKAGRGPIRKGGKFAVVR